MKTSVNLLSLDFRLRMLRRARLRQWLVMGGLSLLVTAALCFVEYRKLRQSRQEVRSQAEVCQPLKAMQIGTAQIRDRLAELRGRQSLLGELRDEQVPYRVVGVVSHSARKCRGRLRVERLDLSESEVAETKQDQPQDAAEDLTAVKLAGIAADNLAVARFVVALREFGVFERVDLKSSLGDAQSGGRSRKYLIECTF